MSRKQQIQIILEGSAKMTKEKARMVIEQTEITETKMAKINPQEKIFLSLYHSLYK